MNRRRPWSRAVSRVVANGPRLVAVPVGVWLVAAPAVLNYAGRAEASDRTVGPIVASLSFVALWDLGRGLRWLTLPMGLWLMAAPLVLWYGELLPSLNGIICGLVIAATAPMDRRGSAGSAGFAGGWQGLRRPAGAGPVGGVPRAGGPPWCRSVDGG